MCTNSILEAMRTDNYAGHDYYLLDEWLTEEHKLIPDTARAWVKKEVSPIGSLVRSSLARPFGLSRRRRPSVAP